MLVAHLVGSRIEAHSAAKGHDYRCPECGAEMILRKGRIRIHHFAHKTPRSCSWASGETIAHLAAKEAFRTAFASRGLRADVEVVVNGLAGDRRADVMVWSPGGQAVAIEIQHTAIGLDEVEARTRCYQRAGIPVVWVPFLRADAGGSADRPGTGGNLVRRYPTRPWERWVHGYNFGRLSMYDAALNKIWQGRFGRHRFLVDPAGWYDADGDHHYAGGYWRDSRRWRELTASGPFELDRIRIELFRRKAARLGPHAFPAGRAARFAIAEGDVGSDDAVERTIHVADRNC